MNYYQKYKKYKNLYYGGNDDFDKIDFDNMDYNTKLKIFDNLFNKLKNINIYKCDYRDNKILDPLVKLKLDNIDDKYIEEAIKLNNCSIILTLFENIPSLKKKLNDEYISKIENDDIKYILNTILYNKDTFTKESLELYLKKLLELNNSYDYYLFTNFSKNYVFNLDYKNIFVDNIKFNNLKNYKVDIIFNILNYYFDASHYTQKDPTIKLNQYIKDILLNTKFDSKLVKLLLDKKIIKLENYILDLIKFDASLGKLFNDKIIKLNKNIIDVLNKSNIDIIDIIKKLIIEDKITVYYDIYVALTNKQINIDKFYKNKLDDDTIKKLKLIKL